MNITIYSSDECEKNTIMRLIQYSCRLMDGLESIDKSKSDNDETGIDESGPET